MSLFIFFQFAQLILPYREKFPWRWIVERTLGWFNHFRRLSKDYGVLPPSAAAVIMIFHPHTLLNRL